jgi:hypothetical protein
LTAAYEEAAKGALGTEMADTTDTTGYGYLGGVKFDLDDAMGSFAEHRMEVLAQKYGFLPTLTPGEAVAWLQAARPD